MRQIKSLERFRDSTTFESALARERLQRRGPIYNGAPIMTLTHESHRNLPRPPFERVALVLQGGGALGAFQAGIYEALAEAGLHPNWIAGTSIGAINAALIAGNSPDQRVEKLRAFWDQITTPNMPDLFQVPDIGLANPYYRRWLRQMRAAGTALAGAPGFFAPRLPPPFFHPPGSDSATSFYDTEPLLRTLDKLVDFDRINSGETRLSIGAVNVRSGELRYFDTECDKIRPEHIAASSALPPTLPWIEIDGECYWDGSVVSNTPLHYIFSDIKDADTLVFQCDLWNAEGELPADILEVRKREIQIHLSSRSNANIEHFRYLHKLRLALANVLDKLPPEHQDNPDVALLRPLISDKAYRVVRLIYRDHKHEGHYQAFEFSHNSMLDHWRSGYDEAVHSLRHKNAVARPDTSAGIATFDVGIDGVF